MYKLQSKFVLVGILTWVIVALVVVFTVPAAPTSADNPFPGPNRGPSNRNTAGVHGTISAVSGNSITITHANGGNPVTLTLDTHSDISLAGEDSLAIGQAVTATYNSQTMVAERILVNFSTSSPSENGTVNPGTVDHGRSGQHEWFSDHISQGLGWLSQLFHWGPR